jgi:hypothetical protein
MTARGFLLLLVLFLVGAMGLIAWRYLYPRDSLEALEARCAALDLPVHSIVLAPGSDQEARFKFLVPVSHRARVPHTDHWRFCHTTSRID